ncbi:MAG: UDP-2,3-diacylglucosamine diphosphatase [Bacteroidota bacterium]
MTKRAIDIVIISDVHLGTYGCHAKELAKYLKSIKPQTLILNGDFMDIWQFKKHYFPADHIEIIHQILHMAITGTKVYYITGNHDDLLRRFSEFSSGAIHLRDKLVFQLNGKKYWIFHGDVFDASIRISPLLAKLGGRGYNWLIRINRMINLFRSKFGFRRMSFAHKVKTSVKRAVKFISDFEQTAIQLALSNEYDYVICGHIHKPQIKVFEKEDHQVVYMNAGDWVENLTALEYRHGKWSIYEYDEMDYAYISPRLQVKEKEPARDPKHQERSNYFP